MIVAAPYSLKESRRELIDEYYIRFVSSKHKEEILISWIENLDEEPAKRIILEFNENLPSKDTMRKIKEIYPAEISILIQGGQSGVVPLCKELGFSFFFSQEYPVVSFTRLLDVINEGVSDVYIMEDLWYRMPQVRKLCDAHSIQIRLVANMIPSLSVYRGTDPTAPFFTPESFDALSKYVDVIEFETYNSWNRFDTLYRIWFKHKRWRGNVKDINFELEYDLNGDTFPREICEFKLTCGRSCVERLTSCRKCYQFRELAETAAKKGLKYTDDKRWVETDKDDVIKNILD